MDERLIRESDVIKLIDEWLDNYPLPRHAEKGLMSHEELLAYIAEAPTIEAKPIVTRNCDYCHNGTYRKSYCQPDGTFIRFANYCEVCGRDLTKKEGEL